MTVLNSKGCMKQLTDISEYNEIVERFRQKGCLSNDYIQQEAADLIVRDALFADCYNRNAFLFVKKDVGMRMYYYINDAAEKADFSNYNDLVVEILFRVDPPKEEIEYLTQCGFRINLIRDQYAAMYKDLAENVALVQGVVVDTAKTMQAVKTACELFNNSFDGLSGNFIPESEYSTLLESGSILVAWNVDQSSFLGALHQVKEGTVNVIGHVAVMKHARGHGVGKALVDAFVEWNKNPEKTEKTRYQLWVQRQNEAAVKMYVNKGFKFLNKSTISLIK